MAVRFAAKQGDVILAKSNVPLPKAVRVESTLASAPSVKVGHKELTVTIEAEPAKPGRPASGKTLVTLRLDPAVVQRFKATGPGWQARINDALKAAKIP